MVDLLGVDRIVEWQEADHMMVGSHEAVRIKVDSLAVDHKEVDLSAADHSVVDLQEVVRTEADLPGEIHIEGEIVVDHIAPEEGDRQNAPPAKVHDCRDCL